MKRVSLPSSGLPGSANSSSLPLPLVSSTNGNQPTAFSRVAGLVEHLGVDPAGHRPGARQPQRVVGVIAELRMVGAEAGVDELVLLGLRIEHRRPGAASGRSGTPSPTDAPSPSCTRPDCPCRARSRRARRGPCRRTWRCAGWPWCPTGPRRPNRPTACVGFDRAGVARSERDRHARIGDRHLEVRHLVGLRIEDRHLVGRIFRRAVERTVGVDRRLAPVRRDQVVQILVGRRPVPGGDDEIALDARGPRRLVLRQLALGDAVGPVAEILVGRAAELAGDAVGHHLAGLAGLRCGACQASALDLNLPNCAGIVRVDSWPS